MEVGGDIRKELVEVEVEEEAAGDQYTHMETVYDLTKGNFSHGGKIMAEFSPDNAM